MRQLAHRHGGVNTIEEAITVSHPMDLIISSESIAAAVAVLKECEEAVTACASSVFDEPDPLQALSEVGRDLDCADVLAVTRRVLDRRSVSQSRLISAQLEACLVALQLSYKLCSSHAGEYPQARICSTATDHGIELCRRLISELAAIQGGVR